MLKKILLMSLIGLSACVHITTEQKPDNALYIKPSHYLINDDDTIPLEFDGYYYNLTSRYHFHTFYSKPDPVHVLQGYRQAYSAYSVGFKAEPSFTDSSNQAFIAGNVPVQSIPNTDDTLIYHGHAIQPTGEDFGEVFNPQDTNSTLYVNFADHTIHGNITTPDPERHIHLYNTAINGSHFAGQAELSNSKHTAGYYQGSFYGYHAEELAGFATFNKYPEATTAFGATR